MVVNLYTRVFICLAFLHFNIVINYLIINTDSFANEDNL